MSGLRPLAKEENAKPVDFSHQRHMFTSTRLRRTSEFGDQLDCLRGSHKIADMIDLVARTEASIRIHALLPKGSSVLVATSGGLDSMVLLDVLHRLSRANRWAVAAAHFNHKLRGRSSELDEQLVRNFCEERRIPFYRGEGDVRGRARRGRVSLEMAARELRHSFLARTALEYGIATVATAHQADDQIELFVLRLLRGSGAGLAGMKWKGPSFQDPAIELIRPFLAQTKTGLREYAQRAGVVFREDASNRGNQILRNRVRNQILPFLCRLQPSFKQAVLRSMEIISAESEFSQRAANRWLAGRKRSRFDGLHPAVQRQVIQTQLLELGISPGFTLIESLRLTPDQVMAVAPGCDVLRDKRGRVRPLDQVSDDFNQSRKEIPLDGFKGEVEFDGLTLRWCIDPPRPNGLWRRRSEPGQEWFDAGKVGKAVILRYWQPGDRFQPIGMLRSVKVQDFLTNQKISRAQRRRLVIATTGKGEIFWVEGHRIGERFKLESTTRRRLGWTWSRQATSD